MQDKFAQIYHKAVCTGCPFSLDVAGQLTCLKFENSGIKMNCEDVTPDICSRLANSNWTHAGAYILNQLKLSQVKLGFGFLIQPSAGNPGEAETVLIGPSGVVHRCTLSELFPEEGFAVFPSMRVFNAEGEDVTPVALKAFLQKIYDKAPLSVSAPFASLLDKDDQS